MYNFNLSNLTIFVQWIDKEEEYIVTSLTIITGQGMNILIDKRKKLYKMLGKLPPISQPIIVEKINEREFKHYIREDLIINIDGEHTTSAYFLRPINMKPPFKTIIFNHSHGGNYQLGRIELVKENVYLQLPTYAN